VYFKLAAGQNYPQALLAYYHCLLNGYGVVRDTDQALAMISLTDESDVTKGDEIQRIENAAQVKLPAIPWLAEDGLLTAESLMVGSFPFIRSFTDFDFSDPDQRDQLRKRKQKLRTLPPGALASKDLSECKIDLSSCRKIKDLGCGLLAEVILIAYEAFAKQFAVQYFSPALRDTESPSTLAFDLEFKALRELNHPSWFEFSDSCPQP
jgi:hypothetical protein